MEGTAYTIGVVVGAMVVGSFMFNVLKKFLNK